MLLKPLYFQEIDYVQKGREILDAATETLSTGEWVFERRTEDGDSLFSRQLDNRAVSYTHLDVYKRQK